MSGRVVRNVAALGVGFALFAMSHGADAAPAPPIVLSLDDGSDVAEPDVRAAVAAELDGRVAPATGDALVAAPRLDVRSRDGIVTVRFRDAAGRTIERQLTAPADGAARVRTIALLAGNLARNEAAELTGSHAPESAPAPASGSQVVVHVAPGDSARVEVVGRADVAPPPAAPPAAVRRSPEETPTSDGSAQRTVGWVAVGAGVVTAAVGGYLGVRASADLERQLATRTTPDQLDAAHQRIITDRLVLAAGALVAAGGLVVVLTAPHATARAPATSAATATTRAAWIVRADASGVRLGRAW